MSASEMIAKAIRIQRDFQGKGRTPKNATEWAECGWADGVLALANEARDFRVEGGYTERKSIGHWLRELAKTYKNRNKETWRLLYTLAGRVEKADHMEINKPKAAAAPEVLLNDNDEPSFEETFTSTRCG